MKKYSDLEYLKLTKFQKFLYKFLSFFAAIPRALKNAVFAVGRFFKNIGLGIGSEIKDLVLTFKNGDWKTKTSYVVMGFGCLARGQILRKRGAAALAVRCERSVGNRRDVRTTKIVQPDRVGEQTEGAGKRRGVRPDEIAVPALRIAERTQHKREIGSAVRGICAAEALFGDAFGQTVPVSIADVRLCPAAGVQIFKGLNPEFRLRRTLQPHEPEHHDQRLRPIGRAIKREIDIGNAVEQPERLQHGGIRFLAAVGALSAVVRRGGQGKRTERYAQHKDQAKGPLSLHMECPFSAKALSVSREGLCRFCSKQLVLFLSFDAVAAAGGLAELAQKLLLLFVQVFRRFDVDRDVLVAAAGAV